MQNFGGESASCVGVGEENVRLQLGECAAFVAIARSYDKGVEQRVVVSRDGAGAGLFLQERWDHRCQRAFDRGAVDDGGDADNRFGSDALTDSVQAEDRVEADEGVGGRKDDQIRVFQRLNDVICGLFIAAQLDLTDDGRASVFDEPILEAVPLPVFVEDDGWVRGIAHWQDVCGEAVGLHKIGGDGCEGVAFSHACGAEQVGADILIAELEPIGRAEFERLVHGGMTVVVDAPAALFGGDLCEGVHQGVAVGRDPQAEVFKIIACVGDHGESTGWKYLCETLDKARSADASGECNNASVFPVFFLKTMDAH